MKVLTGEKIGNPLYSDPLPSVSSCPLYSNPLPSVSSCLEKVWHILLPDILEDICSSDENFHLSTTLPNTFVIDFQKVFLPVHLFLSTTKLTHYDIHVYMFIKWLFDHWNSIIVRKNEKNWISKLYMHLMKKAIENLKLYRICVYVQLMYRTGFS